MRPGRTRLLAEATGFSTLLHRRRQRFREQANQSAIKRRHNMHQLSGTIWVDQELRAARERADEREAWRARQARLALRREETEILRQWRQATEEDRPEIVRRHREVFARIHENKKRAK